MMRPLKLCLLLGLMLLNQPPSAAERPPVIVFAAASLTDALQELGGEFTRRTSIPVKFSFAASSALAKQIDNGAPADVFFAADVDWMDYLQTRELIDRASRHDLLGNQLVLIAPANSAARLKIGPHFPMAAALGSARWVTGDPDSVPVGRYAREALTKLGVWSEVEPRLVRADNVRAALAFVARGEVALGIVYATDAKIDPGVRVVDEFPADTHAPIVYPAALTRKSGADGAQFLDFARSPAAAATFGRFGFTTLR